MNPRARIYIGSVIAVGLLTTGFLLPRGLPSSLYEWILLSVLTLTVILTEKFPLHIKFKVKAGLTAIPTFTLALLFQPGTSMLGAGVGLFVGSKISKRTVLNSLFNGSAVALTVAIGSAVFHTLRPNSQFMFNLPLVLSGIAAALAMYISNIISVAVGVSLHSRVSFKSTLVSLNKDFFIHQMALYSLGFLAAFLLGLNPWLMVLLAVPALLVYGSFKDVVEKARLSEQLEKQMQELKNYQAQLVEQAKLASLGTLASGVAHEVNNPLFVLLGRAETLLSSPDHYFKTDRACQHVTIIYEMGKRIQKIVNNLLGLARDKSPIIPIDINKAIEETIELVANQFAVRGIEIVTKYDIRLPLVEGNRSELQQVFMNFLLNARDAMPTGGVLTVTTGVDNDQVYAAFSDSGEGIPEEVMPHLFEPFFTTKEPGKGTGLGLWVSYRIAQKHGGKIEVENHPGKGATFILKLPALAAEKLPESIQASDSDNRLHAQSG